MKKTLLLLLAAGVMHSAAAAQSADSAATEQSVPLEAAVITARQLGHQAPVTLHTIRSKEITDFLSTKTYPELMRNVGGVYATSDAGNYGDAKINIRGFRQENITVLLNGIPLTGFRSGSMFWNNWLGLTDATYRVQVQKGIGGSMLAASSLGGTVNIITWPVQHTGGGNLLFDMTDYGLHRTGVSLWSGTLPGGWTMHLTGSRSWGQGYVEGTTVNAWAYFLNISKRWGTRHALQFTVLGAPERHGQRSQKLSVEEVATYGLKYNKNWGTYNGTVNNVSENFYHKPWFSADHLFAVNDRLTWSNTLYFSLAGGGGKWTETKGKPITSFLNAGGQIDWNAVVDANVDNNDLPPDGALNIQSDYLAGHVMAGLKSEINHSFTDHLKWSAGGHYQFFHSWQTEQITDLLGGAYWYENYAENSLSGLGGRNPVKKVGDYIRLHNGDQDHHLSLYTQLNYDSERLSAFAGGLFMVNIYRHWDKYNYLTHPYSQPVTAPGGHVKAGGSVKITANGQVYLNGGYYSRAPYDNVYFSSGTNDITDHVKNEKNYLAEAGYKYITNTTQFTVNGYYSYWENRALLSNPYQPLDDGQVRYMITGLDAQHLGVEISGDQRITSWLHLSAFVSIGNWQWKNDVAATIYNPYTGMPVDTFRVFTDGLFVGDAPQTQWGAVASIKLLEVLDVRAECRYNGRMYANFDPAKRTSASDRNQSYRIPASFVTDLHISYPFKIGTTYANVYFSCNNLFNAHYIERGDDGAQHNLETFRGFWGIGRTAQAGLKLRL